MQTFYLYRVEDLHGHSGLGTVAEGVIFDNGLVAMTWLSEWETVTVFQNIRAVERLHSHGGRTVIVLQRRKKDAKRYALCVDEARSKKAALKHKADQGETDDK